MSIGGTGGSWGALCFGEGNEYRVSVTKEWVENLERLKAQVLLSVPWGVSRISWFYTEDILSIPSRKCSAWMHLPNIPAWHCDHTAAWELWLPLLPSTVRRLFLHTDCLPRSRASSKSAVGFLLNAYFVCPLTNVEPPKVEYFLCSVCEAWLQGCEHLFFKTPNQTLIKPKWGAGMLSKSI